MAGVWIPLSLLTPFTAQGEVKDAWWWALVALVLFRFFDMVKPLGIKKLDNRQGAFYVMADDLLGGLYAAVSLIIIKIILVSVGIIYLAFLKADNFLSKRFLKQTIKNRLKYEL